MEELYVDDAEFEAYKIQITKIDVAIEARLAKIIQQLEKACYGISSGCLHTNLVTYVDKLSLLKGQLMCLTQAMKDNATNFCIGIEEIDDI